MKKHVRLRETTHHDKPAWEIIWRDGAGLRKRKMFADQAEAEAEFELMEVEQHNYGISMLTITEQLRSDAIHASELLAPFGISLSTAAAYYADHHRKVTDSETVENAVKALLVASEKKSARYRKDLKNRLERFALEFAKRKMAEIQQPEVYAWLSRLGVAPLTQNSYQLRLSRLWSFARVQHWVAENIIEALPKESVRGGKIGILSVDELSRLLSAADSRTLPYWILGAFCGLRSAELERLDWTNIHWQSRLVEVPAAAAKTASRRFVRLRPNALAWLAPYRTSSGRICPKALRKRLETDRTNAKLKHWPTNCLRHSFASYLLAKEKNAKALALELGHTDSDLIFSNYRELVKPAEAKTYWQLVPDVKAQKKIVAISA